MPLLENELCVVGSLEDIEVPDEFGSMASQLLDLDGPEHCADVTVITMAVKQDSGGIPAFYLFLAGNLEPSVERRSEEWMISTTHMKNDELVAMITDICTDTICDLAFPQEELRLLVEKWRMESMLYAVTTSVPEYNCDGIESLQAISQLPDRRTIIENRQCYAYHHPDDEQMVIRIFEPNTPGKAELEDKNGNRVEVTLQPGKAASRRNDGMYNSTETGSKDRQRSDEKNIGAGYGDELPSTRNNHDLSVTQCGNVKREVGVLLRYSL